LAIVADALASAWLSGSAFAAMVTRKRRFDGNGRRIPTTLRVSAYR
jgi:hypothetical protein